MAHSPLPETEIALARLTEAAFNSGRFPCPDVRIGHLQQDYSCIWYEARGYLLCGDKPLAVVKLGFEMLRSAKGGDWPWHLIMWARQLRDEVAVYRHSNLWC